MKSIMLSIRPEWVEKILNGEKTIEIRKTMPKCELPAKVYIYCTKGQPYLIDRRYNEHCQFNYDLIDYYMAKYDEDAINGKVVAEFILNEITDLRKIHHLKATGLILYKGGMDMAQYNKYGGRYAWHISDLKIYGNPKELGEFTRQDCGNCRYISSPKNPLSDCDRYCSKYNENLLFYDWFNKCERCIKNTRPPQSWCYVEEFGGNDE